MNVLPIVFAMMILMGAITYSTMQSYLVSKTVDRHYQTYFSQVQQQVGNQRQFELYDKFTASSHSRDGAPSPVNASSKLPIRSLFVPQEDAALTPLIRQLFKNLVAQLFGEQPFYKEALEKNPLLLDQLLESLMGMRDQFSGDDIDLKKLVFKEEEERLFWYCLFNKPPLEGESDDESTREERLFVQGFCSNHFQDLITARGQDATKPIRLFLASPELLLAIFQDTSVVSNIVSMRKELFNAVKKDPASKPIFTQEFAISFNHYLPRYIPPKYVNWDVTGTNPNKG